jgi:hypothetical protein
LIPRAAALAFERAAALRDRLDDLRWLSRHLERMRQAAENSFLYPVKGSDGSELWYLIHGGRVRAVLPAPRDEAGREAARAAAQATYRTGGAAGPPGLDEIDGVLLVAAWFHRYPAERERTVPSAERARCWT